MSQSLVIDTIIFPPGDIYSAAMLPLKRQLMSGFAQILCKRILSLTRHGKILL